MRYSPKREIANMIVGTVYAKMDNPVDRERREEIAEELMESHHWENAFEYVRERLAPPEECNGGCDTSGFEGNNNVYCEGCDTQYEINMTHITKFKPVFCTICGSRSLYLREGK